MSASIQNKISRICWNTSGWKIPTGEAAQIETKYAPRKNKSYVAKHGFGHEEWLFNYQWLLKKDGMTYKYGFLQPIGKYWDKYRGGKFNILLYTINADRDCLLVGEIYNVLVPDNDELQWAFKEFKKNGWMKELREVLEGLGISSAPLKSKEPRSLINVCFEPKNVKLFSPFRVFQEKRTPIAGNKRYHPLNWNGKLTLFTPKSITLSAPINANDEKDPKRSEKRRIRAAIEGGEYEPHHTRLQNRLHDYLVKRYGKVNVTYEKDNQVDLVFRGNGITTYVEIKMNATVKMCIRLALGQLLEYSHYPSMKKADKLLVVSDAIPTQEDIDYLAYIRNNYQVPVHYAWWNGAEGVLEGNVE